MCDNFEPCRRAARAEIDVVRLVALELMSKGIAHDFRNLMQIVSSAIRMIEEKLDRTTLNRVAPFISGALQSVDRATALSTKFLSISRMETDFEETVGLDVVVASMELPICWAAGPESRVELVLEPGLPSVVCNIREFENVVLNLVVNARDAMANGGHLRIVVGHGNFDDGAVVMLRVTDTGCGMSPEIAKRAFQPGFTTKPVGRGNGLGLAMVRDFAHRAGGSVQIESAVNCGTSVILRLPACRN